MSQVEGGLGIQSMIEWVARKKWKGGGQRAETSGMGKDMEDDHRGTSGIRIECEVTVSIRIGIGIAGTSSGCIGVGRGAFACDKKGMGPRSGRHPERVVDWGPVLEIVHESPDDWYRCGGGCTCLCVSCGFDQTQS